MASTRTSTPSTKLSSCSSNDLTPTLTVVAEEAKIQVVFDEDMVARYRLIGYENRALDDDQFRDDSVDAGELGAGHQVSALYEIELAPGASADTVVADVRLRWRSTETGDVIEVDEPLAIEVDGDLSGSLRLATLVAHTAELLRGNIVVTERGVTLDELLAEAHDLDDQGVDGADEMVELIATAINAEDPVPTIDGVTTPPSECFVLTECFVRETRHETLRWKGVR